MAGWLSDRGLNSSSYGDSDFKLGFLESRNILFAYSLTKPSAHLYRFFDPSAGFGFIRSIETFWYSVRLKRLTGHQVVFKDFIAFRSFTETSCRLQRAPVLPVVTRSF